MKAQALRSVPQVAALEAIAAEGGRAASPGAAEAHPGDEAEHKAADEARATLDA